MVSLSKPYSGSTAIREDKVSEGAGEDIHESKEKLGEAGGGTGMGDRNKCRGSSDYVRYMYVDHAVPLL